MGVACSYSSAPGTDKLGVEGGKADPKVVMGNRSTGKRVKKEIFRIRLTDKS